MSGGGFRGGRGREALDTFRQTQGSQGDTGSGGPTSLGVRTCWNVHTGYTPGTQRTGPRLGPGALPTVEMKPDIPVVPLLRLEVQHSEVRVVGGRHPDVSLGHGCGAEPAQPRMPPDTRLAAWTAPGPPSSLPDAALRPPRCSRLTRVAELPVHCALGEGHVHLLAPTVGPGQERPQHPEPCPSPTQPPTSPYLL